MAAIKFEEEKAKFRFKMKLEIRWSDMDEMGHVNNAVYLTYFEQGRVYYFTESCQWDWMEVGVILAKANIEYRRPLMFTNPAHLYLRTSVLGTKSFELQYLITTEINGKEELATNGSTVMVMYDYKEQKSMNMPDYLRDRLKAYETEKI